MRRRTMILLLAGMCLWTAFPSIPIWTGVSMAAQDKPPPLEYLAWWVGRYPSGGNEAGHPPQVSANFFEDPNVLPALKAMLPGDALRAMLKGWKSGRVEVPVERKGDVIRASFCKPHACPSENASVLVDMRTGGVSACWKRYDEAKGSSKGAWYAPGVPPRALGPDEDCY